MVYLSPPSDVMVSLLINSQHRRTLSSILDSNSHLKLSFFRDIHYHLHYFCICQYSTLHLTLARWRRTAKVSLIWGQKTSIRSVKNPYEPLILTGIHQMSGGSDEQLLSHPQGEAAAAQDVSTPQDALSSQETPTLQGSSGTLPRHALSLNLHKSTLLHTWRIGLRQGARRFGRRNHNR